MLDTGYWMLDARFSSLGVRNSLLAVRILYQQSRLIQQLDPVSSCENRETSKKPGNTTAHSSCTDRCFLPDLTGLGEDLLRGTWLCGAKRDWTADLCIANAALSQLSYSPWWTIKFTYSPSDNQLVFNHISFQLQLVLIFMSGIEKFKRYLTWIIHLETTRKISTNYTKWFMIS